jgi:hypothetical protein
MFQGVIHRPVFYLETFRILDSVSAFRWYLLSWAQSTELVPATGDWIGFCLRLEAVTTQLDPIDRASPFLRRLNSVSVFMWYLFRGAQ